MWWVRLSGVSPKSCGCSPSLSGADTRLCMGSVRTALWVWSWVLCAQGGDEDQGLSRENIHCPGSRATEGTSPEARSTHNGCIS